jgi:hypothetical protein
MLLSMLGRAGRVLEIFAVAVVAPSVQGIVAWAVSRL